VVALPWAQDDGVALPVATGADLVVVAWVDLVVAAWEDRAAVATGMAEEQLSHLRW
jgi:hypothetical protein